MDLRRQPRLFICRYSAQQAENNKGLQMVIINPGAGREEDKLALNVPQNIDQILGIFSLPTLPTGDESVVFHSSFQGAKRGI